MKILDRILNKIAENKKTHFWIFLSILSFLTIAMMYFYQPMCPGGDFYVHYNRMQILMDALKDGSFPIYMDYRMLDGYGYFIKAFYCDFIFIPFAIIGNFTNAEIAIKSMIFVTTILCGIFTYFAVDRILKNRFIASIAALLFAFAAYRLFNIYLRGALGEALSFTFIPIIFWGLYEIIKGDYRRWYIIAIGFALTIFSHNLASVLSAIAVIVFLGIYWKSLYQEPKRLKYLFLAGLATIALTAYYIFPMAEQMFSNSFYYQTNPLIKHFNNFSIKIHDIILGMINGISTINSRHLPTLGGLIAFPLLCRLFIYNKTKELRQVDVIAIVGLAFLIACSNLFPWNIFPFTLFQFIQFPTRLLEFASFFLAIAAAYYIALLVKTYRRRLLLLIIFIPVFITIFIHGSFAYRVMVCNNEYPNISYSYEGNGYIGAEFLPSKVPSVDYLFERGKDSIKTSEDVGISNFKKIGGHISFRAIVGQHNDAELPLTYYKGYKATLDDKEINISESENGLVKIPIDKSGDIKVWYAGTMIQKISPYITLISIILLCIFIFLQSRKKNPKTDENI